MPNRYYAPIVETTEPTSKTIQRTATMINAGAELGDIRDNLLESDLTEYQVFLAVKAAEILLKDRPKDPIEPTVCIKTVFDK